MSAPSKFEICVLGILGLTCTAVAGTYAYSVFITKPLTITGGRTDGEREEEAEEAIQGTDEPDSGPPPENNTDTGDDDKVVGIKLQTLQIEKELMIYLNDEIGNHPDCRFPEMQLISEIYIGKANALSCRNMLDLLQHLKGLPKSKTGGNFFDFLITNIFEPSKNLNDEVLHKIRAARDSVASLEEELSSAVSCSGPSIPIRKDSAEGKAAVCRFKYDGVVVYADTVDSRNTAIQFTTDVRGIMSNDNIKMQDEMATGGQHTLSEYDRFEKECMYIFVLVTEDLSNDDLAQFKVHSLLLEMIQKRQWRVVPVLVKFGVKIKGALSCLVSQSYYFYIDKKYDSCKGIFVSSFKNCIAHGRSKAAQGHF